MSTKLKAPKFKSHGAAIATAAAVLFATLPLHAAGAAEGKVQCMGVNSCKGHSACKSAKNECKGQNACKGQGFMEMSQTECDAEKAKMKGKS
jgi:hypothetical protein